MFAHFATIGANIAEAAVSRLENQETIKKGENVSFDAYFQTNTKTHEPQLNIEETQKLYLEIAVKDKVYVPNAVVKIEDPNFTIDETQIQPGNQYIDNINVETNEIQVKNISSNTTATIEIPIKFKNKKK